MGIPASKNIIDWLLYRFILFFLTPHITGSKKQSEERAALFAVRVHVIVMPI